ncbi:MAG: tRNA (adenosine(37)-N6)-threonylcarbamoyltransferase complex dimerization subunit type 1 TsaB [Alphaproteobacteria bacterium]|nr:tRNA (adenosine(37)-N6)-threonylcarbamoyltransferase complex dimerization subunit type 1 TsaB [Alphaproteobacteria bacterium]
MRILALDTSTGPASIAITQSGEVIATHQDMQSMHQSRLLVNATNTLIEANGGYAALDAMAVSTGPGGFTGIRIALAAARGFALACDKPLLGISSLEAFAWQALHNSSESAKAVVYINAFRKQAYVQAFTRTANAMQALCAAQAIDMLEAPAFYAQYSDSDTVALGNIAEAELEISGYQQHDAPKAKFVALYAEALLADNNMPEVAATRPAEAFYIRPPDAKPQKPLLNV